MTIRKGFSLIFVHFLFSYTLPMILKISSSKGRKIITSRISSMMPKEIYGGSITWVPITVIFMLRLVWFSLLTIGFWECANSSDVVLNNTGTRTHGPSKHDPKLIEIHKRLRALNKPAVKSIQSPDGDIIDCVLRHKQLAFDHPLLKNRTIRTFSRRPNGVRSSSKANRTLRRPFQVWHLTGIRCPEGTIPVRRKTVEHLMRAKSPELYGKKPRGFHRRSGKYKRKVESGEEDHEHAAAYVEDGEYYGAETTVTTWKPYVEDPQEFSLSQVWLSSGSYENGDLNTIEVGWQVYPDQYLDNEAKFFIYWTNDSYGNSGCYNTECSGFVQTNTDIAIGGTLSPTSVYDGIQSEIKFFVWKDPVGGDWVLDIQNGTQVGYWPADLFTGLAHSAERIEWGGEIVNLHPRGRHTATEMGSGHFAEEGNERASYFRDLKIVDELRHIHNAQIAGTTVDDDECYSIHVFSDHDGQHFFYGGPGFNRRCIH